MPEPEEQQREARRHAAYQVLIQDLLRQEQMYWGARHNEQRGTYPAAKPTREQTPTLPEAEDEMLANSFLIGCDPEFAVLDGDQAVNVRFELGENPELAPRPVGMDHGGDVIELRPEPARGSFTLLKRLRALIMGESLRKLGKYKWRAGAYVPCKGLKVPGLEEAIDLPDYVREEFQQRRLRREELSLGGHIHVGIDPFMSQEERLAFRRVNPWDMQGTDYPYTPVHSRRIKALDHLTHRLEALDILPKIECETRRQKVGYGKFGETRDKRDPNGASHFEYRTMPSWLFDPKIAMLCLTGAKLASVDPEATLLGLGRFHDFARLVSWFEGFAAADHNARRVCEKILPLGLKGIQVNPDRDFRESWEAFAV